MFGILQTAARTYRARNRTVTDGGLRRAGQMGDNLVDVLLAIVVAGVVGYVGLQVGSDTEDSADFTSGSAFDNASTSITNGFETAFGLFDVVAIAFMLAVIVGALFVVRRSR